MLLTTIVKLVDSYSYVPYVASQLHVMRQTILYAP